MPRLRLNLITSARPVSAWGSVGPLGSIALHLVVVVLYSLGPSGAERIASFDEPLPEGLTFLVPPSASVEPPAPALLYREGAGGVGDVEGTSGLEGLDPFAARRRSEDSLAALRAGARDANADTGTTVPLPADVFLLAEVDSAAKRDPESAAPEYPPEMLSQRIEGVVAVRFVVDTTGRADVSTVEVIAASREEFARAVLAALPAMRFTPARIGLRPVRQLAEQSFKFQLPKPPEVPPRDTTVRRPFR